MTEHALTPWRVEEVKTSCGRCFRIGDDKMLARGTGPTAICVYDDYPGNPDNEQKANAAFIVRAVNSHEALVEALGRAEVWFGARVAGLPADDSTRQRLADIRAALSQARS